MPDDLAVDNRALLGALRTAAERLGVTFVAAAAAVVLDDGARVVGVRCVDGAERAADTVLVAAGAHSAGLHPALHGLVRPVKGEILRLRAAPGAFPPPRRTVRALVDGRPVYLVPRADGRSCSAPPSRGPASTPTVTVGGVRDLLRDAERGPAGDRRVRAGRVRGRAAPGQPGQPSADRPDRPGGLLVATGHHRNGCCSPPSPRTPWSRPAARRAVPGPVRVVTPGSLRRRPHGAGR